MGYLLGEGGWKFEGIIGQGFAPIVWDLVCIGEVGECGACEMVVDRDGLLQRNSLVDGDVRLDECE